MLTEAQVSFLGAHPVARFASADANGMPHVVPVCFAIGERSAYFTIDEKPKRRQGRNLKRMLNIRVNPQAALVVDRYDDDWGRLGWVMIRGRADILDTGAEHDAAQSMLRTRYPQLSTMDIAGKPVVAIRIDHVSSWGNLEVP